MTTLMWADHSENKPWLPSRKNTVLQHLVLHCPNQPQFVHQRARHEYKNRGYSVAASPSLKQTRSNYEQAGPSSFSPLPNLLLSRSNFSSGSPFRTPSAFPGTLASPYLPDLYQTHAKIPSKHSCKSFSHQPSQTLQWSIEMQQEFGRCLAHLTASAGLPFQWVEDPEWIQFCQRFLPNAQPISHKVLSNQLIPAEAKHYCEMAKKSLGGQLGTGQCDGWTSINSHHIIVFMVTSASHEVHTVKVYDVSSEQKSANNLYTLIKKIQEILKVSWHVILIAFTSDASGDSHKARKILCQDRPEIIVLDCYAHQINLIVGDYFACKEAQRPKIPAERLVRTEDQQALEKANRMVETINNVLIWHTIAQYDFHLV
ncbi:hypothetical protein SERLA73DRAFT_149218 [Serpula lacrymans var. lacrymans S7.3]|uniref:DUF659 domain-containing protein n=1 Tax=Serpula lacrymans var. lacrymans (strain S7.3) TaxID=936435 RepID=F8PGS5_SERL3|nr:hypothetical protein SERLA73DRAFT_149218 [Serpula lacrymans var. lacrymans S7.3]